MTNLDDICVGIAGVGGIGSNVAWMLVRAGFRRFVLADCDQIESSNLNRQFYFHDQVGMRKAPTARLNLLRIAPQAEIVAHDLILTSENIVTIFQDCHIVVEGFDSADAKGMFLEALASSGRLLVGASGVAGMNIEGIYERQFGPSQIVGDFTTDAACGVLYSPKITLVAARMAHLVAQHALHLGVISVVRT